MNWFIGKILAVVGGKLSGYKTIASGIGAYLLAAVDIINLTFPGAISGVPPSDWGTVMGIIAAGTYAIGRGHGNNKLLAAVQASITTVAVAPGVTVGLKDDVGQSAAATGNSAPVGGLPPSGPSVSPNVGGAG